MVAWTDRHRARRKVPNWNDEQHQRGMDMEVEEEERRTAARKGRRGMDGNSRMARSQGMASDEPSTTDRRQHHSQN